MKKYTLSIIALAFLLVANTFLLANGSGRTGSTLAPSCGGCHGPADPTTLVSITPTSSGGWNVSPGDTISFLLTVSNINKAGAGFNAAVTALHGVNVGEFLIQPGSGVKVVSNEITHTAPKNMTNGAATFVAQWIAPSTPGTYFLRAAGNAVDLTGGSNNDAFNYLTGNVVSINVSGTVGNPVTLSPLHGSQNINTSASIIWSSVIGASGYYYELSTSANFASVITTGATISTSAMVQGMLHNTNYYWRVRASSDVSVGSFTTAMFTTVPQQPPSLSTPTMVTPANNQTQVPLNHVFVWQRTANALDYEWQFSANNFSTILASGITTDTAVTVPNMINNTQYRIRVRARYLPVLSGWRTILFTTFAAPGPQILSPLTQSINNPLNVALTWQAITPSTSYEVQVATTSTFSPLLSSHSTTGTIIQLNNLERNRQYHWRIRALGTTMATTLWNAADFVTLVPKTPSSIRIMNIADEPIVHGKPFSVVVRGRTSNGSMARVTTSSQVVFASLQNGVQIVAGTSATFQQGLAVSTLTLTVHSDYFGNTNAQISLTPTVASLQATSGQLTIYRQIDTLNIPTLLAPAHNAQHVSPFPAFRWGAVANATRYSLQVSLSPTFQTLVTSATILQDTTFIAGQLAPSTQYYWRVRAENTLQNGSWAQHNMFVTSNVPWQVRTNTTSFASITVQQGATVQLVSGNLQTGDVLGVFYQVGNTDSCAGFMMWNNQGGTFTVWGDDVATSVRDGLLIGEQYRYKVWRAATAQAEQVSVQYADGDSVFTHGATSVIGAIRPFLVTQTIALVNGWNIVSANVQPLAGRIDSVFASAQSAIVLAKNGAGQVYSPVYAINSIGNHNLQHGYQVFASAAATLTVTGAILRPEQITLHLQQGWNLVSYVRNSPMEIEQALGGVISSVVAVKNNAGDVYLPQFGIGNLTQLQPGQGYWIYLNQSQTHNYPANAGTKAVAVESVERPKFYPLLLGKAEHNATILLKGDVLLGDEFAVLNSEGRICGTAFANADGAVTMTVWGIDSTFYQNVAGASEGEALRIERFRNGKATPLYVDNINNILTGVKSSLLTYQQHSIIEVFTAAETGSLPNTAIAYPNPTTDWLTVRFALPANGSVSCSLISAEGKNMAEMVWQDCQIGNNEYIFNTRSLPSGAYRLVLRSATGLLVTLPVQIIR